LNFAKKRDENKNKKFKSGQGITRFFILTAFHPFVKFVKKDKRYGLSG